MILNEKYVLVNEIAQHHNIAISNFSPLANDEMLLRTQAVIKKSGTMVIDKTSKHLPVYISELSNDTPHTDLTGLIMYSELEEDYYLSDSQIRKIGQITILEKKKFVRLQEDLYKVFSNNRWIIYPVDKTDICSNELKDIVNKKQFKQIDRETFLTWY